MWTYVILAFVIISCVEAQNGRGAPSQDHGHGWDIRLAVPGEPGSDYPTLGSIPRTTFSCAGKESGYYADVETGCQVFRICTIGSTYGFQSFLCPNGTLFNQEVFVCDWWMNVKCQDSQRLVNARNDMFGNLRLGPQLMKDIKKMLTHPMRHPYDKTSMKSNLIVMQDYKPPAGQLFPNSALIAGPERPPNNIYVPAKQIQQNFQSYSPNDIVFAASTPNTRYIPAGFTKRPLNENVEVFQRQRQNAQYVQNGNVQTTQHSEIGNLVANGHAPQFTQNRNNAPRLRQNQNFNQLNAQYTQNQRTNLPPTQISYTQTQNIPRGQFNQRAQFTDIKNPPQINTRKQNEIISYTKQQYNQEKQPYTYRAPTLPHPSELNRSGNNEMKQNLALVFSFLADSLNAAKEYSQLVKQDVLSSTSTPVLQFENLNNDDLSQITNKISQLTSSHFSGNNYNAANIARTTTKPISTTSLNQGNSNTQSDHQTRTQKIYSAQYNAAPSLKTQKQLLSQFQANNNLNANLLDTNENQIYSGQLYQLPVPDVTYIYNRPQSGNIRNIEQSSTLSSNSPQTTNQNNNVAARNNLAKQSSTEVEIVRSQTLALNPAKLQLEPANEPESFYSQESLDLLNSDNGISAQLQDKIVGIIPHPLEDNKLLSYEKDRSYFLYTKLGQNGPLNAVNKVTNIPSVLTFQLVPSVGYQLEDQKEQRKLFNTFNIDEFGAPRSPLRANLVQASNEQRGTLTSSVDYSVEHPASAKQISPNALYKGPSSYSAPQGSVGSLSRQILPPNISSRLEQFNENSNGYPKTTPTRRFIY